MVPAHSVLLTFSQAIVQAAGRLGVDLPADVARLPEGGRVPAAHQDALWAACCAASADPLVGLRLGLELQVGHLDVVGMLLISCDSVGDAMETLSDYAHVIGDAADFDLQAGLDEVRLRYLPQYTVCRAQRVEMVLAGLVHLTRWATDGRFRPGAVGFAHAPLAAPAAYERLLGCPVRFGQDDDHLAFGPRQLGLGLVQASPWMREHLRHLADERLAGLDGRGAAAQVRRLVLQHPAWGKERVAQELGLSGRHLNRKLAAQDLSFKVLRERLLHQLANEALQAGQRTSTIAERLGFSDENAFARAYRRWSGTSPARYRDGLDEPGAG